MWLGELFIAVFSLPGSDCTVSKQIENVKGLGKKIRAIYSFTFAASQPMIALFLVLPHI